MSILSAAIILFLIMDPLGNAPTFIAVLGNVAPEKRLRIIVREMLIALLILVLFLFFGSHILTAMNISAPALSVSGGVVLFLIALRMIFPTERGLGLGDEEDPFIVPLAMPLIAGPATMTMVVLFASREPDRQLDWLAALLAAWAVSVVILASSNYLMRLIRERGQRALVRLMGMILTAMAVQMLMDGIGEFLSSLPKGSV